MIKEITIEVEDTSGNKTITIYCRPTKIRNLLRDNPTIQNFVDKHLRNFYGDDEKES